MPISDDTIEEDGGVQDYSHRNAPKDIVSRDIVAFSLKFYWNDTIGHSENGIFIPDTEQPYPQGLWQISLKKSGSDAELELDAADDIHVLTTISGSTLDSLQKLIEDKHIASLNGHEKWDSALDELLDLEVLYASGESIRAYAKGGSATLPEQNWDPLWFLEFFNKLIKCS